MKNRTFKKKNSFRIINNFELSLQSVRINLKALNEQMQQMHLTKLLSYSLFQYCTRHSIAHSPPLAFQFKY